MRKNKILIILLVVFLLSGCTKILKNADGKIVKNPNTGLNIVENILCLPNDEETIEVYKNSIEEKKKALEEKLENNEITKKEYEKEISSIPDMNELKKCSKFEIIDGRYEGVWNTIFVRPLAWLIIKLGSILKNFGAAIILITLIIRLILYPVTQKTAMQSENMAKAKPELERLEKKYENKNDRDSMMQKSQEMMAIYKKYNIKPSGCLFSFIQIPIFFAFYESLNRLPVILEGKFLGFRMGLSPLQGIKSGNYLYIIFIILVIAVTYFSFKLNQNSMGSTEQQDQMKYMMNFLIITIGFASLSISIAIALYWITNSGFTVAQNLLVKRGVKNANIIKRK